MNLQNKVAVITGASDGIGKQVALKLASMNVSVALIGRNDDRLHEVKSKCVGLGSPKVESYSCDISKSDLVTETVNKIISDFGSVDILLNIAGVWQKLNILENIEDKEIDDVIDINLKGTIKITKALLPYLKKDSEAVIINVSSRSGIVANLNQSVYSASKWGVTGFTEVLKVDLKGTNIRVAEVHQGKTQTGIFSKTNDNVDTSKGTKPEDLADVIIFMLSRPPQIWLHDVRVEY